MDARGMVSESTKLGGLPLGRHRHLCHLLTVGDVWLELASVIPNRRRTGLRFNGDDIELFKRDKDPADRLLRAWKTDNVTIGDLIRCLIEADLLRQAAYLKQIVQPTETSCIEVQLTDANSTTAVARTISCSDECISSKKSELLPPQVSLDLILRWTKGFDSRSVKEGGRFIGKGGYADVFKGIDDQGGVVAVKRFKEDSVSCRKQFENEIIVQTKCKHENVVLLVGYCNDARGRCLVYEYMCNGSLEEFLEGKDGKTIPTVKQRLSIAKDVASGIAYLNSHNLIHRDIKSPNILLNETMMAKLGDFGITRSGPSSPLKTSTETMVLIGTTPYMAPEYLLSGRLSLKTDSFSYGVLLLELLTGLPAYDATREEYMLLEHVRETFSEENCFSMADSRVEFWDRAIVKSLYDVAMQLCSKEKTRPLVSDVLEEIFSWS